MLRVDFHTHTADDPVDLIPYTSIDLIDRAAELGFGALAITLHERQRQLGDLQGYASERGIVLIRGVERTIQGRHVLLLNFPSAAEAVDNFDAVARLKARHPGGLVIAPHAFYPHPTALRSLMDRHADLFDAVEFNAFYTASFNFNRRALKWARAHATPVVASSDAHRLSILGTSSSLVDAEPDADAICSAVKQGRVQLHTRPLTVVEAGTYFARLLVSRSRPNAARHGSSVPV